MSEQLKFIVDNLNEKPFSRNYNLIRYVWTKSKLYIFIRWIRTNQSSNKQRILQRFKI